MSWELFIPTDVSELSGLATTYMVDQMYDAAVDYAERMWLKEKISAPALYTLEAHDGDDTDTVFVKYPPIVSVSAVEIDGIQAGSTSYAVYPTHIRLEGIMPIWGDNHSIFGDVPRFPSGYQNVKVTYYGGVLAASVSNSVKMGLKLIVAELAMYRQKNGADASFGLAFANPDQSDESRPNQESSIAKIARTWFTRGVRAY